MEWTTEEIACLEEHACEGADAVARALGRSVSSVKAQASRFGISLARRWTCPKCGSTTRRPLSASTGWCAACMREAARDRVADEVHEMEREAMREEAARRETQALYSRRYRLRKKSKSMQLR